MKKFWLIFLVFFVFCGPKKQSPGLKDLDGNVHRLSDFKGKVVVVDFWATWCAPCRVAIPEIIDLYEKYHDKGLVVIGISVDRDINALRNFVKDQEMPYLILLADQTIVKKYSIRAIPTLYIIDKNGSVVDHNVGYSPQRMAEFEQKIKELIGE